MTEAMLRVSHAGPQVTVQDAGRPGLMRYGVPASGPMDRASFAIANAAVGAAPGAVGIEVSRGGLVLDCAAGAVSLAIVGGGFVVQAGGVVGGSWAVVTLRAGERLTVRAGPWGSWAYIAFAGRLRTADWLGSSATHGPSGLGGGALEAGHVLRVAGAAVLAEGSIACPVWARPRQVLRCVMGPQDRFFAPETLADFLAGRFTLTDAADRMGVRLRGPALPPDAALSIPSEPVLRGSVQVSGDGVATVLMADHQTTGGYPKIATVVGCDLDGFAQCRPRDEVRFAAVTAAQAVVLARSHAARLDSYLRRYPR